MIFCVKKGFVFIGIITAVLFFSKFIFAYDETIVHPSLTQEMAKLYNLNFSDNLTEEEIGWIKQGSIDEDKVWGGIKQIRSSNHFYNPSGIKEWKDSNLDEKIPAYFSSGIGNGSKKWAHDSVAQSEYVGGDYTWERAIYDYVNGDKQHAYESIGHILHLIEDATVPAHTRNDFHLSPKELEAYQTWLIIRNFVDYEPYETWTGNQAKSGSLKFDFSNSLFQENKKPLVFGSLDEYFNNVAGYTNTNFFSKDTIYVYSEPNNNVIEGKEILENGRSIEYVYGYDENRNKFKLAKILYDDDQKQNIYKVSDKTPEIHSDYWSRLAPKSILAGAGIIKLFKTEAEKAKNNPSSVQKPPTAVTYYVVAPINKKADAIKSSIIAFYDWGKAVTVAAYNAAKSAVVAAQTAAKTTTVTVFNMTKTGLQLTKEYAFTSVSRYFSPAAKAQLEFDISNPLSQGIHSLEDIIKQSEAILIAKAQTTEINNESVYNGTIQVLNQSQKLFFAPGEEIALSARIKNIGTAIWPGEKISLNVYIKEDLAKQFYHSSWLTRVRPASLGKARIDPGATGVFNFIVAAPLAAGDYFFRVRPVWQSASDEFNWLGEDIAVWTINVKKPEIAEAEKIGGAAASESNSAPENQKADLSPSPAPSPNPSPAPEIIYYGGGGGGSFSAPVATPELSPSPTPTPDSSPSPFPTPTPEPTPDIIPPETAILEFPENPTVETAASFKFSSTKPNSTFYCSLNDSEFVSCGEYAVFENLTSGEYVLKVKAQDEFGNIDATPAEYSWIIETPLPKSPVFNINNGVRYGKIQDAIDGANAGDEIQVDSGTYYENVNVNKKLILKGIDTGSGKPVVNAGGIGNGITLAAGSITIDGFAVTGSASGAASAGIFVDVGDHVIKNNNVSNNSNGIYLRHSGNNTLSGNNVSNNKFGFYLANSNNNTLENNNVSNNTSYGIVLDYSGNNTLENNTFNLNDYAGISLSDSNNNTINSNIVSNSNHGIVLSGRHNQFIGNIIKGRSDGFFIANGYDNTIRENNISFSHYSLHIFSGAENKIYHNNFVSVTDGPFDVHGMDDWDDGYPSGGNYWSDYQGIDSDNDGIGDAPYVIPCTALFCQAAAQDRYPLMNQYAN